ncbi:transposase [Aerococcaceae bacterium zg-ZJ1578]|uniref:IS66 family transposase n=1 Tax=Aerococcaceae bacterium zg-252 TaxID=2796928 RepID=UPI001A301DF0|nr:transposase [Aerococcaceae bacterium zg-1578]
MGDHAGYLHCDMYPAYSQLPYVKIVGCWAHVRRYFHDATPKKSEESIAKVGLDYCNRLFRLEKEWAELSPDEWLELSNNLAERAIKSLVMGRKNGLFSKSFEGAKSTAIILTILEGYLPWNEIIQKMFRLPDADMKK